MSIVLIFSEGLAGGVRVFASKVKKYGFRSFLISENELDPNASYCDGHIYFLWERGTIDELVAKVRKHCDRPYGILNAVESLVGWQISLQNAFALTEHCAQGLSVLQSKLALRHTLQNSGLDN